MQRHISVSRAHPAPDSDVNLCTHTLKTEPWLFRDSWLPPVATRLGTARVRFLEARK